MRYNEKDLMVYIIAIKIHTYLFN